MGSNRPRLAERRPADALVWDVLARRLSPTRLRLGRVAAAWHDLVPPSLARNVFPGRIRGDVLTLYARNSQWLHEVRYLEREILARLATLAPPLGIREIRVRPAPEDATPPPPPPAVAYRPPQRRPPPDLRAAEAPLPTELAEALEAVPDPKTRSALLEAYRALVRR